MSTFLTAMLLMSSCGGGGGSAQSDPVGDPPGEAVTLYHPSGRVAARGFVLTGGSIKTGHWTEYFDQDNGQLRWEGDYRQGAIEMQRPWTEWNADSSVRVDASDQ